MKICPKCYNKHENAVITCDCGEDLSTIKPKIEHYNLFDNSQTKKWQGLIGESIIKEIIKRKIDPLEDQIINLRKETKKQNKQIIQLKQILSDLSH